MPQTVITTDSFSIFPTNYAAFSTTFFETFVSFKSAIRKPSSPSNSPSCAPSKRPQTFPSCQPTELPLLQPSSHPSRQPSQLPSSRPTIEQTKVSPFLIRVDSNNFTVPAKYAYLNRTSLSGLDGIVKFEVNFFRSIYRDGILYGRFSSYDIQNDGFGIISNSSVLCQSGKRGLVKYTCGSVNAFVFNDNSSFCSYSITITTTVCNFPSNEPSYTPTPTFYPTTQEPTIGPDSVLNYVECTPFSVANTNSALQNTASCTFAACSGNTFTISNFCNDSPTCIDDSYIRLYDSNNNEVSSNDQYCGDCSQLTYTVPLLPRQCNLYTLQQGCYASTSCSGIFSVKFSTADPTIRPTNPPSGSPSIRSSVLPTDSPTYSPSYFPSFNPSFMPSKPTESPSYMPSNPEVSFGDGCKVCPSGSFCYANLCSPCPIGNFCPTGSYAYKCPPDLIAPTPGLKSCFGGTPVYNLTIITHLYIYLAPTIGPTPSVDFHCILSHLYV